jgi:hypothetical protein
VIWRARDDRIAFAIYTFDKTSLPGDNSKILVTRNAIVDEAMGRIGLVLWARPVRNAKISRRSKVGRAGHAAGKPEALRRAQRMKLS